MRIAIAILILTFTVGASNAKEAFLGTWSNAEDASTMEILDGFSPNVGAVLVTDENGDIRAGKWTVRSDDFSIQVGFSSGSAEILSDGSLAWNRRTFTREAGEERRSDARILLRQDPKAFVEALTRSRWRTTLDSQQAIFQTTFSTDSGVVALSQGNEIRDLSSWGLSSGILKIGSQTIADARVSGRYFVGITDREDFVVFIRDGMLREAERTSLEDERAAFFDLLLTDEWLSVQRFRTPLTRRFRVIDGELKGRAFILDGARLQSADEWEYSPATGALKIGSRDYVGALIVGETLALLGQNGDQTFFIRPDKDRNGRRFTLADVRRTPLSEKSLEDVARVLAGNFSFQGYTYLFEFADDARNGFIHEFRSIPFNITAETFTSELFRRSGAMFEVEEFVVFDGARAFMRDATITRLAPIGEEASLAAATATRDLIESGGSSGITIRIVDSSGKTHKVDLPVGSFEDIRSFEIVGR